MMQKMMEIVESMFEFEIVAFRNIRFLCSKKAEEESSPTAKIITLAIALILLLTMFILYSRWKPNPATVAGCFTRTVRGPFG